MNQNELDRQFRLQRDDQFISEAMNIHKGFAKSYDGTTPFGNVISDAFRTEIFRADNCNEKTITGRLGRQVPTSVINAALKLVDQLIYSEDYVQLIKVRSWNGRNEVTHGWIVTINRDYRNRDIDYYHRLAKGSIFCTSNRNQSYSLLSLVHNTFCY